MRLIVRKHFLPHCPAPILTDEAFSMQLLCMCERLIVSTLTSKGQLKRWWKDFYLSNTFSFNFSKSSAFKCSFLCVSDQSWQNKNNVFYRHGVEEAQVFFLQKETCLPPMLCLSSCVVSIYISDVSHLFSCRCTLFCADSCRRSSSRY